MTSTLWLSPVGPAQSEELIHFTGRPAGRPSTPAVPERIRSMNPQQRLDSILSTGEIQAFPAFGAQQATISFSESPLGHLSHLITDRGFPPWGVVVTRAGVLRNGGGAVAYLPDHVSDGFPTEQRHWVVPFKTDGQGDWSHEREWRLPAPNKGFKFEKTPFTAILIGDADWRPTPVGTGMWIDGSDGMPYQWPETVYCEEQTEPPRLWREAGEIWVWNPTTRTIDKYTPSQLG
ncbi:hypothetical protein ACWGB8_13000 [Kitasatospora sp. NPDC054939]